MLFIERHLYSMRQNLANKIEYKQHVSQGSILNCTIMSQGKAGVLKLSHM